MATYTRLNVDLDDGLFSGWAMALTVRGDLAVVPGHRDFVRPAPAAAGAASSVDQPQVQAQDQGRCPSMKQSDGS